MKALFERGMGRKVAASPRINIGRCPLETLDIRCQRADVKCLISPCLSVSWSIGLIPSCSYAIMTHIKGVTHLCHKHFMPHSFWPAALPTVSFPHSSSSPIGRAFLSMTSLLSSISWISSALDHLASPRAEISREKTALAFLLTGIPLSGTTMLYNHALETLPASLAVIFLSSPSGSARSPSA